MGSAQNRVHLEPAGEWTPFQWFFTGKGRLDQQGSIWIGLNARKVPGDMDQWLLDDVRLVDLTEALRRER